MCRAWGLCDAAGGYSASHRNVIDVIQSRPSCRFCEVQKKTI
jgi:hypothetical protein